MKPNEHTLSAWDLYFLHRIYYWTIGGVVTAGRKALTFAQCESMEFLNSLSLSLIGCWILAASYVNEIDRVVLSADITSAIRAVFGIVIICAGRYGLHCMLSTELQKRERGLLIVTTAWLVLSKVTFDFTQSMFVSALFALAAVVSAILFYIVNDHKMHGR